MNHGVKITKQGVDVSNVDDKKHTPTPEADKRFLPHLLYALAVPYLLGAKTQVVRYRQAASILKEQPVNGVYQCLHEVSCLFEDLATVSKYVEMCGQTNELHSLWFDVRNHIRHDVREEFDNESDGRKNARAKRLGLNDKLQTSIGFEPETINVGGTNISLSDIEAYLVWAETIIGNVLTDAKAKGMIK